VERCTVCNGQHLQCMLEDEDGTIVGDCGDHDPQKALWHGEWPGVVECREKGWYAIMDESGKISTPSMGNWWPCTKEYPGATEDLNRWVYFEKVGEDPHANTRVLGA